MNKADRFARTRMLIGTTGLDHLARTRVAVFGLGGVGSWAAEALARAGVGWLRLVDHDVVDITNINRQLPALESTIGKQKVEIMARRIREINPGCEVEACPHFYRPERREELLGGEIDFVVDAIDSVPEKVDLLITCLSRNIPVVSAMGAGNKLDPARFEVADIAETHSCPLARVVRRRLRQEGYQSGLRVVFSPEKPRQSPGSVPGSISFVPPVAGFILAGEVVRSVLDSAGFGAGKNSK